MPVASIKADRARDTIFQRIVRRRMKPGEQIPSETQLAAELKMNHQTVRRALAQLVEEGVIVKQRGVGTFVRPVRNLHVGEPVSLLLPNSFFNIDAFSMPGLVYEGARRVLGQGEFNLSILGFDAGHLWENAGRIALDRGVRGVLVEPTIHDHAEDIQRMREAGLAVVLTRYYPQFANCGVPWVSIDPTVVMMELVEGLLARGHRRIAMFRLAHASALHFEEAVLRRAFEAHGLSLDLSKTLFELPNVVNPADMPGLVDFFDRVKEPTAVVVPDEIIATGAFRMCYARGLRVPEDVAIAAVHDHTPQSHTVPLTAMNAARGVNEIAAAAARLLARQLDGEPVEPCGITLPARVEWKASTGVASSA